MKSRHRWNTRNQSTICFHDPVFPTSSIIYIPFECMVPLKTTFTLTLHARIFLSSLHVRVGSHCGVVIGLLVQFYSMVGHNAVQSKLVTTYFNEEYCCDGFEGTPPSCRRKYVCLHNHASLWEQFIELVGV